MLLVTVLPVVGTVSRAGGYQGGYTGWVPGWGIPGSTTQPPSTKGPTPRTEAMTAERAPEALQGLEWVVIAAVTPGPPIPLPTLRARSVTLQVPSLVGGWALHRLLANKGEIKGHIP